jgi:ribose transport system ATP-binding protein
MLKVNGITKRFGRSTVLSDVDLDIVGGEFHALVGENGAGKSTLIKILSGVHRPDAGELLLDGKPVVLKAPAAAQRLGISTIFQETHQIPDKTVAENICLNREPRRGPLIHWKALFRQAEEILAHLEIQIDPRARMGSLTADKAKLVEIARAVSVNARLVIMDEPTANLTDEEREVLFRIIGRLRDRGIAILYVSHRLEEVLELSTRVTVLRNGRHVDTVPAAGLTERALVSMMIGRSVDDFFPEIRFDRGDEIVACRDLEVDGELGGVSFDVRAGEVLGVAGLDGSGRSAIAEALFGLRPDYHGEISIRGQAVRLSSPEAALEHGVVLIPAERKTQGLFLRFSIRRNIGLSNLHRLVRRGLVSQKAEAELGDAMVERFGVRPADPTAPAGSLSGGNQQKVVLGRWLSRDCDLVVIEEPTRGIDVGAKVEVYKVIRELAESGKAVVVISSELSELLGICSRFLVLSAGRLAAEYDRDTASEERILEAAFSGVKG